MRRFGPRYKIIDEQTGKRVTIESYPSMKSALLDIQSWMRRNKRGGRPDITADMIRRMRLRGEDGDHS